MAKAAQVEDGPEQPREPTLREIRATLMRLHREIDNHGPETRTGVEFARAYDHLAFVVDAFLFDVDDNADDGGRE